MKRKQVYKFKEKTNIDNIDNINISIKFDTDEYIADVFHRLEIRGKMLSDKEFKNIINYIAYNLARFTEGYDGQ